MKNFHILLLCTVALVTICSGCAHFNADFNSAGIPQQKYLVGGGWNIEYVAPMAGVCYWVEKTTSKIIKMRSLEKGEKFEASRPPDRGEVFENVMGVSYQEAVSQFYFIPS
ncbi:MAG TPA: hypothetical protein EYN79_03465 [Planctomycetes bacterium]|nr:hypothetical protein [Planctomycetota bacterium]HIN79540.1 hypothetical protein [Planctomycetota bacterium]